MQLNSWLSMPMTHTSHSRDSLGFEPIAPLSNGLFVQHQNLSLHPRDSLGFLTIVTLSNGLLQQHGHMSLHSRASLGFWPIATPPNGQHLQPWHMCLFIPGAALAVGPLQHLQMASFSSMGTCPCIPGTALASGPLQHLQMASTSSNITYPLIPIKGTCAMIQENTPLFAHTFTNHAPNWL